MVGLEWVRDAIIESAGEGVAEAEWEDLEGRYGCGKKATPEAEVEDRAPVSRGRAWWGGGGHEMECLAEVGRVLFEVHECAVERLVCFGCVEGHREGKKRSGGARTSIAVNG